MSTTYYHVSPTYTDGDLLCWNILEYDGLVTDADWKWEDAPAGSDGHLVSLWAEEQLEEVEWMFDELGGHMLKVTIPDDAVTEDAELDWDDPDETRVYITSITEGPAIYPAILARIPAQYIEVIR